jgi:hypothetical protein
VAAGGGARGARRFAHKKHRLFKGLKCGSSFKSILYSVRKNKDLHACLSRDRENSLGARLLGFPLDPYPSTGLTVERSTGTPPCRTCRRRAPRMGSDASAAEVDLLRSQIPFQSDGELVLPPLDGAGVGLVLVDVSNGFCTVGAGNLVSILLLLLLVFMATEVLTE